ncbi:TPR-like protein [Zopfia rhizophila CBS 207.26]|uniref:TPR-like protein n=1 Tax=Zopfia rhizophila CBS 207.26 TaxID=1314779 RepID=A0A6A6DAF1_9PEZI|nr:TPR-like protein [Zopfia rhizophila CBS 207.26]
MYRRSLEGTEKALGPDHTSTLNTVNNLGNLYKSQGKLGDAEKMYQRALEGYENALGPDHTSTLDTVNNLGNLYKSQGKLGEAEEMYRRLLEGTEKALGPDHTSTLKTVNNLGHLYAGQGRLGEAVKMYQRSLEGREKALGPDHTSTLIVVNNLGILYKSQGKPVDAEKMYQRALEGREKVLGPDHTSTLNTVNNLGHLYANQGRLSEAEKMYKRSLEGKEKALGPDHISTIHTVKNLGGLYVDRCYALRKLRVLRRIHHRPSIDPVPRFCKDIVSLSYLCDKYVVARRLLLGYLGRVLIWAGEGTNALIAFEQQIRTFNGMFYHGNTVCDDCACYLTIATKRFVCKACKDVDLCEKCYRDYQLDGHLVDKILDACSHHSFFAVPRAEWFTLAPRTVSLSGTSASVWLQELANNRL